MKLQRSLLSLMLVLVASNDALAKCESVAMSVTVSTVTSTGEPAADIDITLEWLPVDAEPELVQARSDANGHFTFDYHLRLVAGRRRFFGGYSCKERPGHFQVCAQFSGQDAVCNVLSPQTHQAVALSPRSGG
jgi:hypothetical protein